MECVADDRCVTYPPFVDTIGASADRLNCEQTLGYRMPRLVRFAAKRYSRWENDELQGDRVRSDAYCTLTTTAVMSSLCEPSPEN